MTHVSDVRIRPVIVVNKGQNPDAETDYNLFCEITTSALGLS